MNELHDPYRYLWDLPQPLLLMERQRTEDDLEQAKEELRLAGQYGGFPKAIKAARAKANQAKEALVYIKNELDSRSKK